MEIKKFKPQSHKVKAVIYGASGVGKTTFASTAPKPIFASAENGLLSIADKWVDFVEINTLKDLIDLSVYLRDKKHDYETLVIDSISEINDIIKADIEKQTKRAMQLQDWGTLARKIRNILRDFRDLDMHIIFIAQEQNIVDEDKIHKIAPSLNGKAATQIAYFMDIVSYLYIDKTGNRSLTVKSNSKLLTKDRSNKVEENDLDFTNWIKNISKIETGKQEVVVDTQPKLPKNKIQQVQIKWKEMAEVMWWNAEDSEKYRKGKIKAEYNVDSVSYLTVQQANEFVKKMTEAINKQSKSVQTAEEIAKELGGKVEPLTEEEKAEIIEKESSNNQN